MKNESTALNFRGEKVKLRRYDVTEGIRGIRSSNGDVWLYLEDVKRNLNLSDESEKHLKLKEIEKLSNGHQVVSEGSFFKLLLTESETEKAKKFSEWVCEEVLPQLSRRGKYEI